MKNYQKGFTLAEALITMGIIGIIASLTLPALNNNVSKQQTVTALAKAINTLENANTKIALANDSDILNSDGPAVSWYFPELIKYVKGDYQTSVSYELNGSTLGSTSVFYTNDGITYIVPGGWGSGTDASCEGRCSDAWEEVFTGEGLDLIIDTNGPKKPNKYAKDQFEVYVEGNGEVIATGSRRYVFWWTGVSGNSNTTESWTTRCASGKLKPTTPTYCTGSIVDNGYQILYGYDSIK